MRLLYYSVDLSVIAFATVCYLKLFIWKQNTTYVLYEVPANNLPRAQTLWCGWRMEPRPGLLDVTGCPGSVITVLMLSPSKVQYCDNWRMAANLTRVQWICTFGQTSQRTKEKKEATVACWFRSSWWDIRKCFIYKIIESVVVACSMTNLLFQFIMYNLFII